METPARRTPLYEKHVQTGGRMVEFAGWEMPVQYSGILDEHQSVRRDAGVFDISHMGEFFVSGPDAAAWLDGLLTNSVRSLAEGRAHYTLMLTEAGGVIDDLILYRTGTDAFLMVVNAAKIDEDREWLLARKTGDVSFADRSSEFAALAVQGPRAPEIFERVWGVALPDERNRVTAAEFLGESGYAVTTGYTGEAGFELVFPSGVAGHLWDAVVAAGAKPCGLGARDTLRLEMCYPLNGSDLGPDRTPLEAGLGFFCDLGKPFVGRDALVHQKTAGLPSRLAALAVPDKSPPIRPHYPVWHAGRKVGETSSGALSPSLGHGIALAYLPREVAVPGCELEIEVRGRRYKAVVRKKPLYQPES